MSTEGAPKRSSSLPQPLVGWVVVVGILVGVCLGVHALLPDPGGYSRERHARANVESLSIAVELYKLNNGNYPACLDSLAKQQPNGAPPLITADKLLDPWGYPYGYDPAGRMNDGRRPDIWFVPPDRRIGNWPTRK
jgi:hypothetical protein